MHVENSLTYSSISIISTYAKIWDIRIIMKILNYSMLSSLEFLLMTLGTTKRESELHFFYSEKNLFFSHHREWANENLLIKFDTFSVTLDYSSNSVVLMGGKEWKV